MSLTRVKVLIKEVLKQISLRSLSSSPALTRYSPEIRGVVEMWTGIAAMVRKSYDGDVDVAYSKDSAAGVLGVAALEALSLKVDTVIGKLRYVGIYLFNQVGALI